MADETWLRGQPDEYGRILGRIEQKVDQLQVGMAAGDTARTELTERVRQNEHARRNEAQIHGARIERLESTVKRVETKVDKADTRLGALEAPVRKALAQRIMWRKRWIKIVAVGSAAGAAALFVLEPLYKVVIEGLVKRWLGPH